jgi:hypothetical protein
MSGIGPDHFFPTTTLHLPDLLYRGQFPELGAQLLEWTTQMRDSVWRTFPRHCLVPFLPERFQRMLTLPQVPTPDWMTKDFAKRQSFNLRRASLRITTGRAGQFYRDATVRRLMRLGASVSTWSRIRGIAVRHPFLYLPLVEFTASLPARLRTDCHQTKRLLRSAISDLLPPVVTGRTGKATTEPRICWALGRERGVIAKIMTNSALADLGCVEPKRVMSAVDQAASGRYSDIGTLYSLLALESWFAARSSRYPVNPASTPVRRVEHAEHACAS